MFLLHEYNSQFGIVDIGATQGMIKRCDVKCHTLVIIATLFLVTMYLKTNVSKMLALIW